MAGHFRESPDDVPFEWHMVPASGPLHGGAVLPRHRTIAEVDDIAAEDDRVTVSTLRGTHVPGQERHHRNLAGGGWVPP